MSKFSNKSDFCDHLWISAETEEEAFNKFNGTKLYITQPFPDDFSWEETHQTNIDIPETYFKKIEYSSIKDLIPFYPYTIAMAFYSKNPYESMICLSSESFVDREEREILEYRLKRLITIYNYCTRQKIEFDVEEILKDFVWDGWNEAAYRELANRVKINGKKATMDGIHLEMHEYYRKMLVNEMIKNGLNLTDYGYERFIKS